MYAGLMSATGSSQAVLEYLDRSNQQKPYGKLIPDEFHGEIRFENVSLSYPARPEQNVIKVRFSNVKSCRSTKKKRNVFLRRMFRLKLKLDKFVRLLVRRARAKRVAFIC